MTVPFVDVYLDKSSAQSVAVTVAEVVRPEWDISTLQIEFLTKGYLNLTIKVSTPSTQDAFILRTVHEITTDGPIEKTQKLCQFLHDQKLSPNMLAFFKNGVSMDFLYGESMDWESERLWDEEVWTKIAEEMARWHSKANYEKAVELGIKETGVYNIDVEKYWDWIMKQESMLQFKDEVPTTHELVEAAKTLEKELLSKGALTKRFCHIDLQAANCVIDDKGQIMLIDYDFAGVQYVEYELAWFFRSFKERSRLQTDDVPGYDYEINFIRHYLKHRKQLDQEAPEVTENDVIQTYKHVQYCKLFVTLRGTVIVGLMEVLLHNAAWLMPGVIELWKHYPQYKKDIMTRFS